MISHSKKFIFIHIPRTGGTSIEHALENYIEGELSGGGGGRWLPDDVLEMYIRKILGREKLGNAKHLTALDWKKVLGSRYDNYYKFTIVRNPLKKLGSLKRFNIKLKIDESLPKWLWNQSMYFKDEEGNNIVDDVFRFENLEESWKTICNKLEIDYYPLPHINNTQSKMPMFEGNELNDVKLLLKDEFKKLKYE